MLSIFIFYRFFFCQERLKLAQEELMETQRQLNKAKGKLAEVEEGIASLQAKYEECIAKKDELEFKTNQCTERLVRAEKVSSSMHFNNLVRLTLQETHFFMGIFLFSSQLIGGLGDEKGRWEEAIITFDHRITSIVGDVLISSGVIAYLGVFTVRR